MSMLLDGLFAIGTYVAAWYCAWKGDWTAAIFFVLMASHHEAPHIGREKK